jgi:hypothetical protein
MQQCKHVGWVQLPTLLLRLLLVSMLPPRHWLHLLLAPLLWWQLALLWLVVLQQRLSVLLPKLLLQPWLLVLKLRRSALLLTVLRPQLLAQLLQVRLLQSLPHLLEWLQKFMEPHWAIPTQ